MSKVNAVLIDIVSIQKYVYSSNRLKENIGASNIIENIYGESLKEALEKVLKYDVSLDEWKNNPNNVLIENSDVDFEIGYIGGGNALLLFKSDSTAKKFIKEWTRKLLSKYPSLNVAFANSDIEMDNFQNERINLYKMLEKNKSEYSPQTFLPKHGITADCPYSGLSAEVYYSENRVYISSTSYAKYRNINSDNIQNNVEQLSEGRYTCTTNIDRLGQTKGHNHIAIVHIDGNSMGEQFKACTNLVDVRKLSKNLVDVMQSVQTEFLHYVFDKMQYFLEKDSGFKIQQENGKYIIPFRPVLMAGDDITFLTDGRLGIPFAEKYLQLMSSKKLINSKKLSACGGVAIVKTKYPFFRGYNLAEELCRRAKLEARKNEDTSWLDFHVSYGGFSGTLEQIRKNKYTIHDGNLHFGPYLISSYDKDKTNEKNIYHLKKGIKSFIDKENWSRSKVKEFREMLTLGELASQRFANEAKLKRIQLYGLDETKKGYSANLWQNMSTPYFDMIELLDLIPEKFLNV